MKLSFSGTKDSNIFYNPLITYIPEQVKPIWTNGFLQQFYITITKTFKLPLSSKFQSKPFFVTGFIKLEHIIVYISLLELSKNRFSIFIGNGILMFLLPIIIYLFHTYATYTRSAAISSTTILTWFLWHLFSMCVVSRDVSLLTLFVYQIGNTYSILGSATKISTH